MRIQRAVFPDMAAALLVSAPVPPGVDPDANCAATGLLSGAGEPRFEGDKEWRLSALTRGVLPPRVGV